MIDGEPTVTDGPGEATPADSGIAVENVTFRYGAVPDDHATSRRPDAPTLDDVSVEFAPGAWSYVLGVSGSGKSTLARLLVRGWDPESGTIRLGGVDVRELTLDEWATRPWYSRLGERILAPLRPLL